MMRYRERFAQVLHYIEVNLDSDLDIDKLCQYASLSKYHFHRQCSAFFGMPVTALVRLLRLKRAAYQLAYRNKKVVDIALENGYDSHEAFTRAFKKLFGKSPSEFRRSPNWEIWHKHYEPIMMLRSQLMESSASYQVDIIEFPETQLAVMEHRGAAHLLGTTIRQFIQWRKAQGLSPNNSRTFNLVYDDPATTPPDQYRFDVCCTVKTSTDTNAENIVNKVIPAGKCAVIRHRGSDDSIGTAVRYLYFQWLDSSDFTLREFPMFFERVKFLPEVSESEMITDIFLPIE
ncbi:AraC family transcriptional regulator [Microbulbifer variabilis]|uniref:AraC family transcriptional regulator n=1 Tax=Microbulbifer variabilis TaxID=266805 RepID=UPI001CFD09D4|nr:AraC family transcriptional regulator [Microbulbifer variabilis]